MPSLENWGGGLKIFYGQPTLPTHVCIYLPLPCRTAVHAAAFNDNMECMQLLVSRGASTSLADNMGRTPLMMAAHFGHANVVGKILLLINSFNPSLLPSLFFFIVPTLFIVPCVHFLSSPPFIALSPPSLPPSLTPYLPHSLPPPSLTPTLLSSPPPLCM